MGKIITGDAHDVLADMDTNSVHMAMCSPPYYGLRDYDVEGQIGLEETLDGYIQNLVDIGEELKRVLRPDGSWWLNLGDSFSGAGANNHHNSDKVGGAPEGVGPRRDSGDLGRKNKMLVPHRTAIALQESGWVVRNDAVWEKTNPMPESVTDRLATTFEFVFFLTPNADYWFNLDNIRVPHTSRDKYRNPGERYDRADENRKKHPNSNHTLGINDQHPKGKNPGDIFRLPTDSFAGTHFAVYPPELCKKPIKATCPENGTVLDPFCGAGTTCLVAKRLGREFIGIELNPKYADMARARCGLDVHDPTHLRGDDDQTGIEAFTHD